MKSNHVYIIAEIGQAHDGSLGILHSFVDAVKYAGVNAVKFQTHIAEAESSPEEPFRTNFSYEDPTRFHYWKRMEFSKQHWQGIKSHCDDAGLDFMASPFSIAAVELLEELQMERYKIGSGEISNLLMLHRISLTKKPIILSSGMSNYSELDQTVNFLKKSNSDLSILQCTTQYPTPAEQIGLNVIQELKNRYKRPVGLSDHSGTIFPSLAAVALGASIIEVHVTFDKRMFGPDTSSSLTIEELKQLVTGIRYLETALQNPVNKEENLQFDDLKSIFEKSLAVNKELSKGHRIILEDLESKKPAKLGIPAKNYTDVIGKTLKRHLSKYSFLRDEDLNDRN